MLGANTQLEQDPISANETDIPPRNQNYLKGLSKSRVAKVPEASQPFRERIEFLTRQAAALAREIEGLKWLGLGVKPVSVSDGLDFYEEVRRFEISLIVQALKVTRGSQKKAANLLRMNHTTLNSKIKSYHIEW